MADMQKSEKCSHTSVSQVNQRHYRSTDDTIQSQSKAHKDKPYHKTPVGRWMSFFIPNAASTLKTIHSKYHYGHRPWRYLRSQGLPLARGLCHITCPHDSGPGDLAETEMGEMDSSFLFGCSDD